MSWRPSATVESLRLRARILAQVRAFFDARGVLEVDTPALSAAGVTDPALACLSTELDALGGLRMYLHTSPEFAMKRLLAAGSGDIYQICRVYRDGELGRWHQPEFTLLEWYRVGWDDRALMDEAGALLTAILGSERREPAIQRLSYAEAFLRYLGVDPDATTSDLAAALETHGLAVPAGLERRSVLDLALSASVVPALPRTSLTFIYDFPVEQAALARIKPTAPPLAARFEAFFDGLELANGYWELTDPAEQRARFEAERAQRRRAGLELPPVDEELLAALAQGLPDCAGIAVGLDRLVAATARLTGIDAAMSFAHRLPAAANRGE